MKFLWATCLVFIATAARADERTVFGLRLGNPIALPECPFTMSGSYKLYEVQVPTTCIEDAQPLQGYGLPVRRISFSSTEQPEIVKYQAYPLEVQGIMVGLHFLTRGIDAQEDVLSVLEKKYGRPKSLRRSPIQNRMGARFESIEAHWLVGKVAVSFYGTTGSLDYGEVFVDLPAALELRHSWEREQSKGQRPM